MWEVTQTIRATVGYPHLSTKKVTNESYVGFKDAPDIYIIKGSLGGETSVLRTFRMSGKELVKERVSQRNS